MMLVSFAANCPLRAPTNRRRKQANFWRSDARERTTLLWHRISAQYCPRCSSATSDEVHVMERLRICMHWLRNWFLRVMSQRNRRDSQGSLTSLVSIYIPPSSTRRGSLIADPVRCLAPFASLSLPCKAWESDSKGGNSGRCPL